jgi:DNA-binding transcriptional LysR family regulator
VFYCSIHSIWTTDGKSTPVAGDDCVEASSLVIDTRFLESFVLAVDNGSIAEAARRLNLTAAAVAKRIHALENDIGAALVTRSGRTIRPTEAGAAIIERARRFLAEARDFKSIAVADRPSGQLRLGAFSSALSGLLPDILALMNRATLRADRENLGVGDGPTLSEQAK